MFVPVPALIVVGCVFLLLVMLVLRGSRPRDPLLGGQPPAPRVTRPALTTSATGDVEQQIRARLAAGRKIDAIKLAREAYGLGLSEAKDLVDSVESQAAR